MSSLESSSSTLISVSVSESSGPRRGCGGGEIFEREGKEWTDAFMVKERLWIEGVFDSIRF